MQIGLVELYNQHLHGRTNRTSPNIDGNYIVIYAFEPKDFVADPSDALQSLGSLTQYRSQNNDVQPSLELVNITRMEGGEDVAVILTGRVKRLQRLWRRR